MKSHRVISLMLVVSLCMVTSCAQKNAEHQSEAEPPRITQQSTDLDTELIGNKDTTEKLETLSLAELAKEYRSTLILRGPGNKREVALTFDDAPDETFTPQILDALKREGVKATFYVVGNRIEAYPHIFKRIVQEGHVIGNHSYNHANLPKLSDAEFRDQVITTDLLISQFTGKIPNIIRPPYGNISEEQIKWLASQNKKVINWNVDSLDWEGLTPEEVEHNILSTVTPGAIVLQHAATGTGGDLSGTVQALPNIISKLRSDGYRLVTDTEMLGLEDQASTLFP
ncbi:hypothetical protein JCM10914A_26200 [Paenibacillus sp. JCM 10914]|uniref:polysaccharide deacetylase family protein n=1 Tax=Paenibacillus sp. JCM 10914 TaxID=1236974 RepID=UPI000ABB117F|nr:polysaccharide deacetylase family protein [Paenibacillus sp. JCM 10914]